MASAKSLGLTLGVHGTFGENWGTSWSEDTLSKDYDAEKPFGSNMVFGGGAFVNIPLVSALGLQPEVNYMVNNGGFINTYKGSLLGVTGTITAENSYKYSSIDIPVFLSVKFLKFNFLAGPYISIPVSQLDITGDNKIETSFGNTTIDPDPSSTSYDISSSPLFGMAFGFDYINRIGLVRLVVGARYMLDFTPVAIKNSDDTKKEIFTRRALTANLGVAIPL